MIAPSLTVKVLEMNFSFSFLISQEEDYGSVVVKVDTGMSRNGCQPEELDSIMNVSFDIYTRILAFSFDTRSFYALLKCQFNKRRYILKLNPRNTLFGVSGRFRIRIETFFFSISRPFSSDSVKY